MAFAYVRSRKVKNTQYLIKQRCHAHRTDTTSEVRPGAKAGTALVWTPAQMPVASDPKDYRALYRSAQQHFGFAERQGAAISLHLLVGVSPEWITAAGGLHDPKNLRNQQLLDEAVAWARSWAGEEAVYGARLDLDEASGGVVDVFCAPTAEQKHKSGATKRVVSVNKPLTKLQTDVKADCSYEALQTSWHAWAQLRLDPELLRGEPKTKTKREHLSVVEYKRQQNLQAEKDLRIGQDDLARREAELAERERQVDKAAADLERKAAKLMHAQKDVFKAAVAVLSDPTVKAIHLPAQERDPSQFDTTYLEVRHPALMQARPLWPVMRPFLDMLEKKLGAVDRLIADLGTVCDQVEDHLRARIERVIDEADTLATSGYR